MNIKFDNGLTVGADWRITKALDAISTQTKIKNRVEILDRLLKVRAITDQEYADQLKELMEYS